MSSEDKRIILVTGASRGVGKGTALALADENTIVYISGRSKTQGQTTELPGTLSQTQKEIQARGAKCVPVYCDHSDDDQIEALIAQVIGQQGRLDMLINNVYQVPDDLLEWKPFWQRPINQHWQAMINVGLRAHYVAAYHAAPHMVAAGSGTIVNISSPAARTYIHSVIYGLGKAAKDKMMHDMGKELREHNVAAFALWPGIVKTERLQPAIEADALPKEYQPLMSGMESSEFTGRILNKISNSGTAMNYTGRSWWNAQLAKELSVVDIDGSSPESYAPFMGEPGIPPLGMIK